MASLNDRISVPEGILFTELSGEAVILNTTTGKYFGLDEVGTRIWILLAEHGRVEPAFRALIAEYNVEEERLKADLLQMIDRLAELGLMHTDEA